MQRCKENTWTLCVLRYGLHLPNLVLYFNLTRTVFHTLVCYSFATRKEKCDGGVARHGTALRNQLHLLHCTCNNNETSIKPVFLDVQLNGTGLRHQLNLLHFMCNNMAQH